MQEMAFLFFNEDIHLSRVLNSKNQLCAFECESYTLNTRLVKVGHVGIKGGSLLVNTLVD